VPASEESRTLVNQPIANQFAAVTSIYTNVAQGHGFVCEWLQTMVVVQHFQVGSGRTGIRVLGITRYWWKL
jgi:hypothetical protein